VSESLVENVKKGAEEFFNLPMKRRNLSKEKGMCRDMVRHL
jgi:hypothetical protein